MLKQPVTPLEIKNKLSTVLDPEIGVDIVNLGFIYDIQVKEKIEITMTLTSLGCPLGMVFESEVKAALSEFVTDPDEDIVINLTFDPPWTPEMMSEEARLQTEM